MLEWPGNSLDLNPIENSWLSMKRIVAEQQPSSLLGLQHAIKSLGEEFGRGILQKANFEHA